METYYGLADCHGIESFMCEKDFTTRAMLNRLKNDGSTPRRKEEAQYELRVALAQLEWRARANYQRHATIYQAILTKEHAREIQNLLNAQKFVEALLYLKEHAKEIHLPKDKLLSHLWKTIPNHEIDPFYYIGGDKEWKPYKNK